MTCLDKGKVQQDKLHLTHMCVKAQSPRCSSLQPKIQSYIAVSEHTFRQARTCARTHNKLDARDVTRIEKEENCDPSVLFSRTYIHLCIHAHVNDCTHECTFALRILQPRSDMCGYVYFSIICDPHRQHSILAQQVRKQSYWRAQSCSHVRMYQRKRTPCSSASNALLLSSALCLV